MDEKKSLIKRKLIVLILLLVPIITIFLIVLFRYILLPSNEKIINDLKNINCYSTGVEYIFKNSREEFREETTQYYSKDKGFRIEFGQEGKRVKVYKGGEIQVKQNESDNFILNEGIDAIYPVAFIDNILSNKISEEIKEGKEEWGDGDYLEVDIKYNIKNKHFNKGKFYIDKKTKSPILLKILDDEDKERVIIIYKDFKIEKQLSDDLF
ncbi:germination lipoprotein GerS-related protein [Clostridium uliginosum]|uniref:Outer membrane lipoprotein-sorting protein n=1 Tax=Clostridium uliginosum TaxID=119641 RepID=A0A1I1QPU7_9CLOT|nr:germination lipoprotein GerS-related protein [Clostridium uliginosum]SFD21323.1 Outer membrane lipoprotein-sorting protein [Clostridium uliginosum]